MLVDVGFLSNINIPEESIMKEKRCARNRKAKVTFKGTMYMKYYVKGPGTLWNLRASLIFSNSHITDCLQRKICEVFDV